MIVTRPSCASRRSASRIGPRETPSCSASGISLTRSPGASQPLTMASRNAPATTSVFEGAGPSARKGRRSTALIRAGALDDVVLGTQCRGVEALDAEWADVDRRLSPEHEVADDFADGRALQEAVAGAAGRV